jgi:hypothetical protein
MVRRNSVISVIVIALLTLTACSKSGGSSGGSGDGGQRLTGPTDIFKFTVSDDGALSVSAGMAAEGAVIIPAWYRPDAESGYLPVTAIANNAFAFCTGITSITLPEGVTEIGYGAFAFCTDLASITIPATVTAIGGDAFASCTSLVSITIPASVTLIDNGAFFGWTDSQTINIQGKANGEAAIAAGWGEWWDYFCDAAIIYGK